MTPLLSLGKRKEVCNCGQHLQKLSRSIFKRSSDPEALQNSSVSLQSGLQMPLLAKVFY